MVSKLWDSVMSGYYYSGYYGLKVDLIFYQVFVSLG